MTVASRFTALPALALFTFTSSLLAQSPASTPTHRSTAARRSTGASASKTTAAAKATPGANAADTPPNIPAVPGQPKPLFALRYVDIAVGSGPLAEPQKYYTVRYTGWLTDGTKFDSSDDHPGKEPITFPYGARRVIIGWDTGFEGMHVGGKRRLYVPYQLAYGDSGRAPVIPPKADLIFDVELVSFSDTPTGPAPDARTCRRRQQPGDTGPSHRKPLDESSGSASHSEHHPGREAE